MEKVFGCFGCVALNERQIKSLTLSHSSVSSMLSVGIRLRPFCSELRNDVDMKI